MKVLWIVSTIFPYPAEQLKQPKTCFGGWLNSLHEEIIKIDDIEIAIAATYKGNEFVEMCDGRTTYYLIPDHNPEIYNKKLEEFWRKIATTFNPDIIHIHGTEYPRGLSVINSIKNIPVVSSIQGLISNCSRVFYANLPFKSILMNLTLRDIIKPRTGIFIRSSAAKRGKYELEILKKTNAVIGRTTWDHASVLASNPRCDYYHGDENLRSDFYVNNWDINNMKRETIFFSQAQSPIKGFHLFLDALYIVKKQYPKVVVRIAGNNLLDDSTFKKRIKRQSYTKHLGKMVKKYDLADNIKFTGYLNEEEIINELKSCNAFVQSSSIENSSNSLCEAMIMGVPCVASNVGGTDDMMTHHVEGFLYPYTEVEMLAYYIMEYFKNDKICIEYGNAARKRALIRHNSLFNCQTTVKTYKDVIKNFKGIK